MASASLREGAPFIRTRRSEKTMEPWESTVAHASAHFLEHGYCIVPNILSASEVAELRATCLEYYERTHETEMFATHLLSTRGLGAIPFRRKIIDVARSVLGPEFSVFPNFTVRVDKYREWHVDRGFVADRECLRGPFRCMQMAVQLQDNDPESGGGMDVAPASLHERRREGSDSPNAPVTVLARAGDLVAWDGRLRHRGTPAKVRPAVPKVVLYWSVSQSLPEHVGAFLEHLRSREYETKGGPAVRVSRYADIQNVRFPDSFLPEVVQTIRDEGLRVAVIPPRAATLSAAAASNVP
jgi:hypothetical protein